MLLRSIGRYDRHLIGRFKRTLQFTAADFDLLTWMCDQFARLLTTPHILTEVSNLCGQLPDSMRKAFRESWRSDVEVLDEMHVPGRMLVPHAAFLRFGLTDAAIEEIAERKVLVLTDDLPLALSLEGRGLAVINFNHIRSLSD